MNKSKILRKFLIVPLLISAVSFPAVAMEKGCHKKVSANKIEKQLNVENHNSYPVVLVHGFMGWGRSEALGFKYWGGTTDLQEKMRDAGYEVYTATVGPVSSNWDRACELYAYIKGGRVDYGLYHSQKYGHERYGRVYPGIYNKWGQKDSKGDIKKIHLVGHSMGGQTVRTLVQLLEKGSKMERKYTKESNLSPLFKGNKKWACSVTTISTPNDGTTAADGNSIVKIAEPVFATVGVTTGLNPFKQYVMDFKLDQWGLQKKPGEFYARYVLRMLNSNLWFKNKDISTWDLSTDGAKELNKWVKAQPDVYYFSWTTKATKKNWFTGHSIPDYAVMNKAFYPNSLIMGRYTRNVQGRPVITKEWWPNDGYVNVISQDGPKLGSTDVIKPYNGKAIKGQWNKMPILEGMDHEDIIGRFADVSDWYVNLCKMLESLPK